ncbi:MAG: PAS domain-containing protein [Gemmatimonadota bacterium]
MADPPFRDELVALRAILATIPDFVVSVDRGGRILFINRVQEDRDMAAVVGKDARDFIHPDSHDAFEAALESIWSTGDAEAFELAVPNLEGVVEWYRNRMFPLRQEGRTVAAVLIATDVTELKAAERDRDLMRRLLPICAWCDKIRGEDGEWQSIEVYLKRESGADVTHGMCPDCAEGSSEELPANGSVA